MNVSLKLKIDLDSAWIKVLNFSITQYFSIFTHYNR